MPEIEIDFERNVNLIVNNISNESQIIISTKFGDIKNLKQILLNLCSLQNIFNKAISNSNSHPEISNSLLNRGFYIQKNFLDADLVKLNRIFLLKRYISNLINGSTFGNYNYVADTYLADSMNNIIHYISDLNIFNDNFFNISNVQLSTSSASPTDTWAVDTLEFHSDTAIPNLKVFCALNHHNSQTGQYSFIDIRSFGSSRLNLISLASWLAIQLFPNLPFNNSVTEKFGRSLLRNIFNEDFLLEHILFDYDSVNRVNFDLDPGDMVLSYNIYPHARILGNSGWSNRRIFFHPIPYPRMVI